MASRSGVQVIGRGQYDNIRKMYMYDILDYMLLYSNIYLKKETTKTWL